MNLFDLVATLGLDSSEYEKGLDGAESKANSFGSKLKSGLATVAKVTAGAVGAGVAGVTALTKAAVDSFSSYEQLKGGIETLFGDSAEQVMRDASNAYKTAGMDANKYMETSIQAAAALINSLEGDTETAAELMNMSIIDMSDNVNKMGTTMEAVQNAYRGFSRGNFTMLDNLALGFSGTKAGMEALLKRATEIGLANGTLDESVMRLVIDEEALEKATQKVASAQSKLESQQIAVEKAQLTYNEAVKKSGANSIQAEKAALDLSEANRKLEDAIAKVSDAQAVLNAAQKGEYVAYDINSYSDIVKAIHVVQKEMGIAGTTAEEAEGTITGSFAALRAGWKNLVTSLATGEGDIDKLINDLVEGATLALGNILPAIERSLSGIGTLIEKLTPIIGEKLPQILSDILPALIQAAVSMVAAFAKAITDNLPEIVDAFIEILGIVGDAFIEYGPTLLTSFVKVIGQILEKITDPDILSGFIDGAVKLISVFADAIINNIPVIADAIIRIAENIIKSISKNLPKIIKAAKDIITSLVKGLMKALPELTKAVPSIIKAIVDILNENLPAIIDMAIEIMTSLIDGLQDALPKLMEYVPKIVDTIASLINNNLPLIIEVAVQILVSLINGLSKALPRLISYLPTIINTITSVITENLPLIVSAALDIILALVKGLMDNLDELLQAALDLIDALVGYLLDNLDDILDAGFTILTTLIDGILNNLDDIIPMVVKLIAKIGSEITQKLPDLLAKGGEMLGEIISGILGAIPDLIAALPQIFNTIFDEFGKQDWLQLGKDIIIGIGKGILSIGGSLFDVVDTVFTKAYNAIADIFGLEKKSLNESTINTITSQTGKIFSGGGRSFGSEETTKVGRKRNNSDEDVGYVTEDQKKIVDAFDEMLKTNEQVADFRRSAMTGESSLTSPQTEVIINVSGAPGQDVSELADIVSQRIAWTTHRERAVW